MTKTSPIRGTNRAITASAVSAAACASGGRRAGAADAVLVSAGQANDSPIFPVLLAELRVLRQGWGRPRTRPKTVIDDKAYSARAHRAELRRRGITTMIPEPSDQIRHRKNRGSAGGRPPAFNAVTYRDRNVVERAFNQLKGWRGLATCYDKHARVYRGGLVLASALLWLKQ